MGSERLTAAIIPPDKYAPTTQCELQHRHNANMPCSACYIESLRAELAQAQQESADWRLSFEASNDHVDLLQASLAQAQETITKLAVQVGEAENQANTDQANKVATKRATKAEAERDALARQIQATVKYLESLNDNLPVLRHVKTQVLARLQPTGGQTP